MITDFFQKNINIIKNRVKLPYRKLPKATKNYIEDNEDIPPDQIIAFNTYKNFKGYLNHLFALNPSIVEFYDSIQKDIGYKPQPEALNLSNIVRLEIARCKLAYPNIEGFIRDYNQNRTMKREIGIHNNDILSLSSYRRDLDKISVHLLEYAQLLIQECRELGLIADKIWVWDRRFIKCNCNGVKNRLTGLTSDPDSGKYVKKSGTYNVLSGTGYTDTCIVDFLFGLPVYWDAVDASKNDNTVFQETVRNFKLPEPRKPIILLADAGPDSYRSNIEVINRGIIPVIAARSNCVGNILKTDRGNHFRADFIPRKYHQLLQKIYDIRTTFERKNSFEVVGYNRSKMLTRGIKAARMFVSIANITALLTALTAFKVQRNDLIKSQSAFRKFQF
ncbi:MAG: transposase [Methanolobus sp.]|nr:transposase [Methanolobus sp.]